MPGAILVTRLKVYDTPSPDGQCGGTPHVHFLCTEMYFVLEGSGFVEMIDATGFSRTELRPHSALVFSPGTIHRLINPNKDMEILVIMQNSGLPERGDNVVTFKTEIMNEENLFRKAMTIQTEQDAYRRRDQGVEGFLEIKAAFLQSQKEGSAALEKFYKLAVRRTANLRSEWQSIISNGALSEAQTSLGHLDALANSKIDYLFSAQHHPVHPAPYSKLGFCGHLNRYFDPATLALEGVVKTK